MTTELPTSQEGLLERLRELYATHGCKALSTDFLAKDRLYARLLAAGLKQADYLAALGLEEEFGKWKVSNRTYAGKPQHRWYWGENASLRAGVFVLRSPPGIIRPRRRFLRFLHRPRRSCAHPSWPHIRPGPPRRSGYPPHPAFPLRTPPRRYSA